MSQLHLLEPVLQYVGADMSMLLRVSLQCKVIVHVDWYAHYRASTIS
jgi:hypothetical protein